MRPHNTLIHHLRNKNTKDNQNTQTSRLLKVTDTIRGRKHNSILGHDDSTLEVYERGKKGWWKGMERGSLLKCMLVRWESALPCTDLYQTSHTSNGHKVVVNVLLEREHINPNTTNKNDILFSTTDRRYGAVDLILSFLNCAKTLIDTNRGDRQKIYDNNQRIKRLYTTTNDFDKTRDNRRTVREKCNNQLIMNKQREEQAILYPPQVKTFLPAHFQSMPDFSLTFRP